MSKDNKGEEVRRQGAWAARSVQEEKCALRGKCVCGVGGRRGGRGKERGDRTKAWLDTEIEATARRKRRGFTDPNPNSRFQVRVGLINHMGYTYKP